MALLDQIANPNIADPRASFEEGRQIGQQNLTKDLAGEILSETLSSKVGLKAFQDLQKVNPDAAIKLKSILGSERDSDNQYFVGLTKTAAKIIQNGGTADDVAKYLAPQIMLTQKSGSTGLSQKLADSVRALKNPETAETTMRDIVASGDVLGGQSAGFSAKTVNLPGGLVQQTDNQGNIYVTKADGTRLSGKAASDAIKAAEQSGIDEKVSQVSREADARTRASRTSEIKQKFSQRRRDSAREQIRLNQAMKAVDTADQGIQGAVKVQLARIFPGIDVTDEAILSQSLTGLALDQLQKFKGPTTDFEFGVTESIAGRISDSKSANKARLNSLDRANWFNQRQSQQFNKFIGGGGDPDEFAFNFGEKIKTKNGEFTLRQLQDTAVAKNMTINQVLTKVNK